MNQTIRVWLGGANVAYAVLLLVAIPPTTWMLAIWAALAAVGLAITTFILLFRRVLRDGEPGHAAAEPDPAKRKRRLRAAFPPLAALLCFAVLSVQGADLEVHETTEVRDYWLLAAGMVLAVFTLVVSYDRSRRLDA